MPDSPRRRRRPAARSRAAKRRAAERAVEDYLRALAAAQRPDDQLAAVLRAQLDEIEDDLVGAAPIDELLLVQERRELEARLSTGSETPDLAALEAEFVAVAAQYGAEHQLGHDDWIRLGVSDTVLRAAQIRSPDG